MQLVSQPRRQDAFPTVCRRLSQADLSLQNAFKRKRRVVVVHNRSQISRINTAFFETVVEGVVRETPVILETREPLFLRRRNNLAISNQSCRRVVIKTRNSENICGLRAGGPG